MAEEDSSDSDVQSVVIDRHSKDPSQDPRSPYFLHPSENPGAVLVSPSLNDNNYHNWSRAMRRALSSKNKIKFINGTLLQPPVLDPNYNLWDRCNNMVISWITRTLSPHIYQSTICIDSAYELWKDLEDRFTYSRTRPKECWA
ncbi:uncharacterized protein [Medicago truncatula]|uniref:uncharacterized protein n=1 Tax=Medicago truncatula TaxID=3880 RepID=UPI00196868C4|nr:uncharacterized protein LOC120576005 [Medicago truncatula]